MNNLSRMRENLFKDFFEDWALFNPRMRTMPGTMLAEDFPVDIRETDHGYIIEAEMPGLQKSDIKVDIDGKRLLISAEVRRESESKEEGRIVQRERYYGMVSRTFSLDCNLDAASAKASYQSGVLRLEVSKASPASGQRIEIQ